MREYTVTAYPYAIQYGTILVPDDVAPEDTATYIENNWNEIRFRKPELDYEGTDFEFEQED